MIDCQTLIQNHTKIKQRFFMGKERQNQKNRKKREFFQVDFRQFRWVEVILNWNQHDQQTSE